MVSPVHPPVLSLDFLAGDDARSLAAVAALEAASEILELADGGPVLAPGSSYDGIHLLLMGSLALLAGDDVIELLEPGHCVVGRPDVGAGTDPGIVRVVAAGPARVARISADALAALQRDDPATWRRLHSFFGRQIPSLFLASIDLFAGVDTGLLEFCDEEANWLHVKGGDVLIRQGHAAGFMLVVVQGSLEVVVEDPDGTSQITESAARGAVIGETALLGEGPSPVTVRAVRDSQVVRISRADFERVAEREPAMGMRMARALSAQLHVRDDRPRSSQPAVRTVCVVAAGGAGTFASTLADALAHEGRNVSLVGIDRIHRLFGPSVITDTSDLAGGERLVAWLNEQEDRVDLVVYDCRETEVAWVRTALRQADLVIVVVPAAAGPGRRAVEDLIGDAGLRARVELVLLQASATRIVGTDAWLAKRDVAAHHQVREDVPGDLARLARRLAGRSLGVVLSGGGARGFAHIGVLHALADAGLHVDHVGGTSMGAVIAAEYAMEMSLEDMIRLNKREFGGAATIGDLTLPMLALGRGRSSVRLLKKLFGEAMIEDLPIPYFCVSCNLSQAEQVIHDRGPVWLWTRASSSVPGIGPPVPYQKDLLVDGGVLNNLPADVLFQRNNGPIVSVDVSASVDLRTELPDFVAHMSGWNLLMRRVRGRKLTPLPTILQILARTSTLTSANHIRMVRSLTDLYLRPPVDDVNPFGWDAIEEIVDIGYAYATKRLQTWESPVRQAGRGTVRR